MGVLLITYDLKQPVQNYTKLYNTIKTAQTWWHYLDSTWLIVTNESPEHWYRNLKPAINKNDGILIIEVKSNYYGWLSKEAWDWIQKNITT